MGYRVYDFSNKHSESAEFEEAMEMTKEGMRMAKEGFEIICELSQEMRDQYGERRMGGSYSSRSSYGNRGSYGERGWEDDMYGERRRRDSRGRYM